MLGYGDIGIYKVSPVRPKTSSEPNTVNQLVFLMYSRALPPLHVWHIVAHCNLAELHLCETDSKDKFLCLGGVLPVSLWDIMEGELKSFFLLSLPLCVILFPPPVFPPPPTIPRSPEGGLSTLWLVFLAVVKLRRMPPWLLMLCLIKMDQHITLAKAALFSISLKRQHLMRIGASPRVREELCWVIHLRTVFFNQSTWVTALAAAPIWISLYMFYLKDTSTCLLFWWQDSAECSRVISVMTNEPAFTAPLKMVCLPCDQYNKRSHVKTLSLFLFILPNKGEQ